MKEKIITIFVFLSVIVLNSSGQNKIITGRIYDESEGMELIGATIKETGTSNGATSDLDGNFQITVSNKAVSITVSYVGYETKTVLLTTESHYNIQLKSLVVTIQDVVVVGYGVQKKESVVGAISQITAKDLGRASVPNLTNSLAGRASGIITIMGSGKPGDDNSTIYVRGQATPNGSSPLVLVDGMERDWKEIETVDIESLSILKDASATAVFGVRGANGVILITTKRGQLGKPTMKISYESSFQQAIRLPKYLRSFDYASLLNEALRNDNKDAMYTPEDLEHYRLGDSPYTHPDNDYYQDLLNDMASQHLINTSVSGGTEFVKYYISANYMTQEGLYREIKNDNYPTNNRYTRSSVRSNVDFNITKTTSLGIDLTGRVELRNQPNNNSAIFDRIQKLAPNWQPYINPDGSTNNNTRDLFNPTLMISKMGYRWNYANVLEAGVKLDQKMDFITQGLSFKFQGGYNSKYNSQRYINEEPDAWLYTKLGSYQKSLDRVETSYSTSRGDANRNTSIQFSLNYAHRFNKHQVSALALYLQDQYWNDQDVPYSRLGWVGRTTYSYFDRYFFELNAGYNGSTNFAKDKRYALFPAVSLGWLISGEKFWEENIKVIDYLKIRGSYGEVGNDEMGSYKYFYEQIYYQRSGGDGDGSYYFGIPPGLTADKLLVEGKLGNANVTWERALKSNIGVDMKMFNSKLSFSGDIFREKRVDILGIPYNTPLVLGMGNPSDSNRGLPPGNINEVENRGFDLELSFRGKANGFNYFIKGNYTFARNKYLKIDEQNVIYDWQSKKGKPIGQIFGLTDIGLYQKEDFRLDANGNLLLTDGFPTLNEGLPVPSYGSVYPGDCKYLDLNNDNVIDQYDIGDIGKSKVPEYSYGITLGGEYKSFDFNILFQGAGGANMPLSQFAVWEFYTSSGSTGKVMEHHLGRYNPEDPSSWTTATYPLLHYGSNSNNHQSSTRWLFDRSYLRLKNIEIGYTLSKQWISNLHLSSVRVFASGTNLFTWDKMMSWDPESSSETGSAYPQLRRWSLGINVVF
ncbi:MAG: TonB-dependent receptor [Dysgonamonadaceae bacterium]|jgi:TonB-linked SusC/RagA family outer membrane protein|nr:TonB-dependent receptor [Dysgonamonadaceae bacterium]